MIKRPYLLLILLFITLTSFAQMPSGVRTKAVKNTVTLTFDDGPSPVYTPQVLKILKKYKVRATFFVMGWAAKKYPQLIKQMVADGNTVALHTNSHRMMTKLTNKELYKEVVIPKQIVKKIIGKTPVCLRPPYGVANERVKQYIRSAGLVPVALGFNSFDYERRGVKKLTHWVVSNARSGRVFLLHDGYTGRQQTVAALPGIINGIRKKGLGFSVICQPR